MPRPARPLRIAVKFSTRPVDQAALDQLLESVLYDLESGKLPGVCMPADEARVLSAAITTDRRRLAARQATYAPSQDANDYGGTAAKVEALVNRE